MHARIRVPAAVAAVTALALSAATPTASADANPARDAAAPGDIVGSAPSAFRTLPGRSTNTSAWRVEYRSTTAKGAPTVVSGTVIVPRDGRTGPRPLVSYAVGTVGLHDSCAPSAGFPRGTTLEAGLIQQLILRGWAVAVTDYEGLGTPGDHTYTVGRSAGQSVLDAARAAQRLPGAAALGVSEDSPVGIMGYSQGGQAAGWAAELHDTYAPELKVKGTAAGGVPGDLAKVADFNDGSLGSGLILMAASGQNAAFPELNLDAYLNNAGKALVGFMKQNCVLVDSTIGSFKRISDLTVQNPLDRPDWQRRLRESGVGTHKPDHPVYLYHAFADELIPYAVGKQVRQDWCAKGGNVEWRTIVLGEHVTGVITESVPAANWLADRFAGRQTHGNC